MGTDGVWQAGDYFDKKGNSLPGENIMKQVSIELDKIMGQNQVNKNQNFEGE